MKKAGIVGIYLAAGLSKRFGQSKLLPAVGKFPLGSIALMTAIESKLDKIVVVMRESDELNWIPSTLFHSQRRRWFQTACSESVNGQAYSLKCGLRFAEKLHAEAIMVMLADQPLISRDMINQMIEQYQQKKVNGDPISFIAASRLGVSCPPILFASNLFEDLYKLEGDMGARYLIRNKMDEGEGDFIEFTNPNLFFDVDTVDDYRTLLKSKQP